MLFYKGAQLDLWPLKKSPCEEVKNLLEKVDAQDPASFLLGMDKKHVTWTDTIRHMSQESFEDVHRQLDKDRLYMGKIFWKGVNLDAKSMDSVGEGMGIGRLSGLRGEELNKAR
ncbi:unnamed protein product, partial [Amoebophrya sp. A120]|eukprot:GSA120T00004728001.1